MIIAVFFLFFCVSARAENPSAYEIYSKLLEESVDSNVRYSEGMAAWELTIESSSPNLLRLMSPSSDTLGELIQSLTKENRQLFLREFFSRKKGKGQEMPADLDGAWRELLEREKQWGDHPAFFFPFGETREQIFHGDFPGLGGLEGAGLSSTFDKQWNVVRSSDNELAEQFGPNLSSAGEKGNKKLWRLTFHAQESYADFEDLLRWIRKTLGRSYAEGLSDYAEFHEVIFPDDLPAKKKKIQPFLSKTVSHYQIRSDPGLMRLHDQAIVARVLSGDLSGIQKAFTWNLGASFSAPKARELARRFGVPVEIAEKALFNIAEVEKIYGQGVFLPLMYGQKVLGEPKKKAVELFTRIFIEESAKALTKPWIGNLVNYWIRSSSLLNDVEYALRPHPRGNLGRLLSFAPSSSGKDAVDVGKIALGIEYTGRFPIETSMPMKRGGHIRWDREREEIVQGVARELSLQLRGNGEIQKRAGGHGHNLGYSYAFADGKGRNWRVDWDGIQRKYDTAGNIVEGSRGGGHLEVVTAKFIPKDWEVEAVYRVFNKFDIIPQPEMAGGGHINVELAPFEGRPHAMARFLTLYHQFEEMILLMFSVGPFDFDVKYERLVEELVDFQGSERELKEWLYNQRYFYSLPDSKTRYNYVNIIPYFQEVIPSEFLSEDFDYQNPTISWKPRFRFVAPEEKRMELRFFDAPRNPFESALHIRFVRAMLHNAFNQDFPLQGRTERGPDSVAYSYLENPQRAFAELDSLCITLQLDCRLYRPLLAEGLNRLDIKAQVHGRPSSHYYASLKKANLSRYMEHDPIWGRAVSCREQAQQLLEGGP